MFPLAVYLLVASAASGLHAVPPAACFSKFRSQDCGGAPKPVVYYWQSGSRCEVGIWRGCLPNTNMFPDEYECVATCIFSARAAPEDYHSFNEVEDDYDSQEKPDDSGSDVDNDTDANASDDGNETSDNDTTGGDGDTNDTGDATGEAGDKEGATAGGNETGSDAASDAPAEETTAAPQ